MFEELMTAMQKEPIASAIIFMGFVYGLLKLTGIWEWLPRKIFGEKEWLTKKEKR